MSRCYVGIRPCGCVVAATVDDPDDAKTVAQDVAGFLRSGLKVEPMDTEEVRKRLRGCPHHHGGSQQQVPLPEPGATT